MASLRGSWFDQTMEWREHPPHQGVRIACVESVWIANASATSAVGGRLGEHGDDSVVQFHKTGSLMALRQTTSAPRARF